MRDLLRNRVLWVGAAVPAALAALLIYGTGAFAGGPSEAMASSAAASVAALTASPQVALPPSLANAVAAIDAAPGPTVSASMASGSVDSSQAHLLLHDVGSSGESLYAATTDNGKVCIFETDGPAGCVDQFGPSMPIAWMGKVAATGGWSNLVGLVPDDVSSVSLDEGEGTQQATVRNNAFYIEPAGSPSAIIVTYDDGTSQSVALPSFP